MSKDKNQNDNVDFTRFKDLARKLVAVPKIEAEDEGKRETVVAPKEKRPSAR